MADVENLSPQHGPVRTGAARGIVLTIVAASVFHPWWIGRGPFSYDWNHTFLALFGLVAVIILQEGDLSGLGFSSHPIPGWRYWFRIAIGFGLLLGLVGVVCLLFIFSGIWPWRFELPRIPPWHTAGALLFMCLYAPLVEEILYRSLLGWALEPMIGSTATVIIGGIIFAAAHVVTGNPGPDNQIAGFMLMWAFLKSRTILVPFAMHSAGNFIAVAAQTLNWYWSFSL